MKNLAVLLSTTLVLAPALGQVPSRNIELRSVVAKPRPPIVRMAHKPLVLAKMGPLTPADKAQFIASAKLAFSKPGSSGAKPQVVPSSQPTTQTITVSQPVATEGFSMAAYNVGEWDPDNAGLLMNLPFPPNQSNLGFNVVAAPNNLYVLAFQVDSYCAAQFSITTAPDGTYLGGTSPTETVNVSQGKTGFAYAFDATSTGGIWVQVEANCAWEFESAELTTTPM